MIFEGVVQFLSYKYLLNVFSNCCNGFQYIFRKIANGYVVLFFYKFFAQQLTSHTYCTTPAVNHAERFSCVVSTPPVGMKSIPGNTSLTALTKAAPNTLPGKSLTILTPSDSARIISVGVIQPGIHNTFSCCTTSATSSVKPGLMIKSAPAVINAFAADAFLIVPIPRYIPGISVLHTCLTDLKLDSAASPRLVYSTALMPALYKAFITPILIFSEE